MQSRPRTLQQPNNNNISNNMMSTSSMNSDYPHPHQSHPRRRRRQLHRQKHYDIDVIQVSNIALAIKNKEHTINIELSVRCENLPLMKTFGSTDLIVAIYKSDDMMMQRGGGGRAMGGKSDQIYQGQGYSEDPQNYKGGSATYSNHRYIQPHSQHYPNSYLDYEDQLHPHNKWLQIGRTQIIYNELSPKFIKTFVFSYNEEKQQKIQFRIYDIVDYGKLDDLQEQVRVGTVTKSMQEVAENDHGQFQIQLQNKKKGKAVLKTSCAEYDSGNSKYQIGFELSNFVGKMEVFYVIEVLKLNEWIPIAKSQKLQIKKHQKFRQTQISYSKFPAQDNSRVKIKIYQVSKTNAHRQQEIGSSDELTIINILTIDDKIQSQRVYKNGFVVGVVKINKWRKVIRDSFISYIVNGATLHLILGIDFSNSNGTAGGESGGSGSGEGGNGGGNGPTSNSNSNPNPSSSSSSLPTSGLHRIDPQTGSNPYIMGIRNIIGVLQYFDYYNQIALYGFGAKLPPYYKNVGQCFALNGNYFNPIVVGGVEEIIKQYISNLQKNKLHGPTNLSEMIDLAIQYADTQQNSSNYYVLVLMTDGQINDFNQTADKIVKASSLPLSIVIVGIGDKDFTQIEELDSDARLLKSPLTGDVCERDIVDFIKLDQFNFDKTDVTLARETFAEIPSQFIEYMIKKNIKPNREKKSLKAAKQDFISQKIKESKSIMPSSLSPFFGESAASNFNSSKSNFNNSNNHNNSNNSNKPVVVIPQFLQYKKKKMKKELIELGFDSDDPLLKELNIAMNDLNYFIEVHSYHKKVVQNKRQIIVQRVAQKQQKTLEEYLDKKDAENKKKTLEKLQKIETNQYGRQPKKIVQKIEAMKKQQKHLLHPCLQCRESQIDILHFECGHAAVCSQCSTLRCIVCKYQNFKTVNLDELGEEEGEGDSDDEVSEEGGKSNDGYSDHSDDHKCVVSNRNNEMNINHQCQDQDQESILQK